MTAETVRHSLWGASVLGGVVAVLGTVGAVRGQAPFPGVLQPLLVFVVLAATVGGLTGPLVVPLLGRAFGRTRDDARRP